MSTRIPFPPGPAPGAGPFHFDFLLNSTENSKRVTVASKLVSRSVSGLLFILSGQIYAITLPFRDSDIAKSLNGRSYERRFLRIPRRGPQKTEFGLAWGSCVGFLPALTPAACDPLTSAPPDPRGA